MQNACNRNDCNGRCRESETDKVPCDEEALRSIHTGSLIRENMGFETPEEQIQRCLPIALKISVNGVELSVVQVIQVRHIVEWV